MLGWSAILGSMVLVLWLHRCRHVRLPSEVNEPPRSICGLGSKVESRPRQECRCRPAHAFHHHQQHQHLNATARLASNTIWFVDRAGSSCLVTKVCVWVWLGLGDAWIWSYIVMTWSCTASPHSRWQTCIAIASMDAPQSSRMVP